MKISQKLSIGFAAIATPITLFSILMIGSVGNELKEVGDFHSPNLYLIQNYATKTTEVVGESFAYIASGDQSEKEVFLSWAKEIEATKKNFVEVELTSQKEESRSIFQKFIQK